MAGPDSRIDVEMELLRANRAETDAPGTSTGRSIRAREFQTENCSPRMYPQREGCKRCNCSSSRGERPDFVQCDSSTSGLVRLKFEKSCRESAFSFINTRHVTNTMVLLRLHVYTPGVWGHVACPCRGRRKSKTRYVVSPPTYWITFAPHSLTHTHTHTQWQERARSRGV